MAWIGYYEYGGTEVINASRVEAYARTAGVWSFKPVYKNTALAPALGEVYANPLQDDAPWTDEDDADTYDFLGVYPLDIGGIDDSTWGAAVTESTRDGGIVGRGRYASKTIVFNVILIGKNEAGCEAGLRWLKTVMTGPPCLGSNVVCGGSDLCYLASEPILDWTINSDVSTCLDPYLRSLHGVTVTVGPTVTAKADLANGSAWTVSFTVTAGNPYEFSAEVGLISGFMDPNVDVPYVGGIVPDGGSFDDSGFVQTEVKCPVATYQPIVDPLCPQVIAPPQVPNVALSCFEFPVNYVRRQFIIPKGLVPLWGDVVPFLVIKAQRKEIRNLRVRFYADPFDTGDPNTDPCNYCGDIVFSYIPANSTLVFDGPLRQVYIENVQQGRRRADSLVFRSDGNPFEWPVMSCGFAYVATFDLPQATSVAPIVDFSLFGRAA